VIIPQNAAFVKPFSQMFTKCLQLQIAQKRKKKETKKTDVPPYNPLLSKEINKKERKEYNREYLYTSLLFKNNKLFFLNNFVYKYILYIIANSKRFVKSFKMFTKCLQFTY